MTRQRLSILPWQHLCMVAVLLAVTATSGLAQTTYKVLLKSGEELFVADYWLDRIDKNVIRLDMNATMQRIPRDSVNYIAPAKPGPHRIRTAIRRIGFAPKPAVAATPPDAAASESAPDAELADPVPTPLAPEPSPELAGAAATEARDAALREEAERIDREREAAKELFKQALADNDATRRQQSRQQILDLTLERSKLLDQVKVAHNGSIPAWWRWKTDD